MEETELAATPPDRKQEPSPEERSYFIPVIKEDNPWKDHVVNYNEPVLSTLLANSCIQPNFLRSSRGSNQTPAPPHAQTPVPPRAETPMFTFPQLRLFPFVTILKPRHHDLQHLTDTPSAAHLPKKLHIWSLSTLSQSRSWRTE